MTTNPNPNQFLEVLEVIEEINVQAQRLLDAAQRAKVFMTAESESEYGDDS